MWDKCCYIRDSSHAKLMSQCSKLLSDDIRFLRLQHLVMKWRFNFSNACNFFICAQKWSNMSMHCVTIMVGFVEIYIFCHFVPAFQCKKWEEWALFSWWHVEKNPKTITDFRWQKENANPRVHHSSGKLGKPYFPLERWTLRLGFSCPHRTSLMDSIYLKLLLGEMVHKSW